MRCYHFCAISTHTHAARLTAPADIVQSHPVRQAMQKTYTVWAQIQEIRAGLLKQSQELELQIEIILISQCGKAMETFASYAQ